MDNSAIISISEAHTNQSGERRKKTSRIISNNLDLPLLTGKPIINFVREMSRTNNKNLKELRKTFDLKKEPLDYEPAWQKIQKKIGKWDNFSDNLNIMDCDLSLSDRTSAICRREDLSCKTRVLECEDLG